MLWSVIGSVMALHPVAQPPFLTSPKSICQFCANMRLPRISYIATFSHFSHILAKSEYRIFSPNKLTFATQILIFLFNQYSFWPENGRLALLVGNVRPWSLAAGKLLLDFFFTTIDFLSLWSHNAHTASYLIWICNRSLFLHISAAYLVFIRSAYFKQEALLMQRNRASTLSVEIV